MTLNTTHFQKRDYHVKTLHSGRREPFATSPPVATSARRLIREYIRGTYLISIGFGERTPRLERPRPRSWGRPAGRVNYTAAVADGARTLRIPEPLPARAPEICSKSGWNPGGRRESSESGGLQTGLRRRNGGDSATSAADKQFRVPVGDTSRAVGAGCVLVTVIR